MLETVPHPHPQAAGNVAKAVYHIFNQFAQAFKK